MDIIQANKSDSYVPRVKLFAAFAPLIPKTIMEVASRYLWGWER